MTAPILHHESRPLKERYFGRSCFPSTNRVRSVTFSDGGLRDREINSEMKWISYFVSLAAWFSFQHAKLTAGREGRVWILPNECVFFSFFSLPTVFNFHCFHDQTHTLTQTRKVRRDAERPKGDREQFASLTRFLDYILVSNIIWFVHRIN